MSILIEGMKMPAGEDEGLLIAVYDGKAYQVGTGRMYNAIEIPTHGRLIDADEYKKWLPSIENEYKYARKLLDSMPTIIEAEEGE